MKFNTNNKAAQKQRRIGALERLRVNLEDNNRRLNEPIPSGIRGTEEFKAGITRNIKRISAEITILEGRVK